MKKGRPFFSILLILRNYDIPDTLDKFKLALNLGLLVGLDDIYDLAD